MPDQLELSLLGPWQAFHNAVLLPQPRTRHVRALLARLALAHPTPVAHRQLQSDLFPELTPDQVGPNFRTTLYYLRQILGELLVAEGNQVSLAADLAIRHDVGEFERLSASDAPFGRLQEAMRLVRGPFLEDDYGSAGWAEGEAQRLHNRYVDLLHRIVALAWAAGRPEQVLEAAERWVTVDPRDERPHRAVIAALALMGDRARGGACINRARSLLRDEWEHGPSPEFEALVRMVNRLPQAQSDFIAPLVVEQVDPTFVNRTEELRQIRAAWVNAQTGATKALVIEGEAGVGKTRLVEEFVRHLPDDALVLQGCADERTLYYPFGLLRDAIVSASDDNAERLRLALQSLDEITWNVLATFPELPAVLPERPIPLIPALEGEALGVHQRVAVLTLIDLLVAQQPLLFVFDDVHDADPESLRLVEDLYQSERRILILLLRRPQPGVTIVSGPALTLAPLAPDAARQLFELWLGGAEDEGLMRTLVRISGGNPLLASELARSLLTGRKEGIPPQEMPLSPFWLPLLSWRIAALSASARELVNILALVGRPVEPDLLTRLIPDDTARIEATQELVAAQILAPQRNSRDQRVRLAHDGLMQAVLGLIDDETRRRLHRRISSLLRAMANVPPLERMRHHAGAEEWAEALEQALMGATHTLAASRLGPMGEALEIADRAVCELELPPDDPCRWSFLTLRERAAALTERGSVWAEALAALSALAEGSGRLDWRAEALVRQGLAAREQGIPQLAENLLRRAADLASTAALPVVEAHARGGLASLLDDRGMVGEAIFEGEGAIWAARTSGDAVLEARTLTTLAYMLMRDGRVAEADALLTPLLESPVVLRQPVLAARVVRQLGIVKMAAREYEVSFTLLRESVRLSQATGDLFGMLLCQTSLFFELTRFGLYAEATPLGKATLELARHLAARTQIAALHNIVAVIFFNTGDLGQAWVQVEASTECVEVLGLPEYAAAILSNRAEIALALQQLDIARTSIERAEQWLTDIPHPTVPISHRAAEVWLTLGMTEQARHAARQAVAQPYMGGLRAIEGFEALWTAAAVLSKIDGSQSVAKLEQRAYDHFLDDVSRISSPSFRRAFINATVARRAMAARQRRDPRRLVFLPLPDAPTGRPLNQDELVPVVWTIEASGDPQHPTQLRHAQLRRLASEALAQGAVATVETLADGVQMSDRTISRDIEALRHQGIHIQTRGNLP